MTIKKNQLLLAIGVIAGLLLLSVVGISAYKILHSSTAKITDSAKPEEKKKKRVDTYNTLAFEERPYIEIQPKSTGHDVIISINQLKKPTETVEYELEYQAGELLQGAFGTIDISSFPATKEILLGTRSAGGATTYHENVKGGTLVTRFAGTNSYALKSDWRFIENKTRAQILSSKDVKFQIESPEFSKQPVVVISNSPGYPSTLPGTAVSDAYAVSFPTNVTGKAKVSFQVKDAVSLPQIAVWDGQSWKAIDGKNESAQTTLAAEAGNSPVTIDVKQVTANVEIAKVYVLISK